MPNLKSISGKVIVLDAGHGGIDPGAEGRTGLQEKTVTLEIAKELQERLSLAGVKVVLTRQGDEDLADQVDRSKYATYKERDLWRRVEIANQSKADLFLSIHVNSFPQSIWSGAQTFYQEGGEEGARLARAIQDQLVERLGPNRRKARPADYRVLRSTNMPATIVEVGFISNPREEGLLQEAEYKKKIAEAIFLGVVHYFSEPVPKETSLTLGNHHSHVFPYVPEYPLKAGQVRLYFADPNNEDIQLREEIRDLTGYRENWDLQRMAEAVLYELSRGPGEHSALLPAAPIGSWLKKVEVLKGIAHIALTPEYEEKVDGGGASEILALYAIVNTLTGLPGIDGVVLRSETQKGPTVGGHILFDHVFKRENGYIAESELNSQKLNNR